MSSMNAFEKWWHNEGSGMGVLPGEDCEEHAKRVAEVAWSLGEYQANEGELRAAVELLA